MNARILRLPRSIKHSVWNVLDAALYPTVYMATAPMLIKSMGSKAFGLWIILNTIITALQLFNFNMGVTAMRHVAAALAVNNKREARNATNGILHITLLLFSVAVVTGFFIAGGALRRDWWHLQSTSIPSIFNCILLAAIIAGLRYFDQVFQGIIKGNERFMLASVLNIVNRFGILAINLYLALSGASVLLMLAANIIFILCYLGVQFFCIRYVMPFYRLRLIVSQETYNGLLRFSIWPWLQALFVVIAFQTDRFWVSAYAGLEEVSGYGLAATMFNHIHIIFTAMVAWLLPRIAAMNSQGEDPSALYDVVRSSLLGLIVVSLLIFYFISPALFRLWAGDVIYHQMAPYIRGFVGFELVFAHTIMPFFYLNAVGEERMATKMTLLYCSCCYILMIAALLIFHNPAAMISGMTLSFCITAPLLNMAVRKAMHQSYAPRQALSELAPMYLGILMIYSKNNWVCTGLGIAVALLLWKFYLSTVFNNRKLWKQLPHT